MFSSLRSFVFLLLCFHSDLAYTCALYAHPALPLTGSDVASPFVWYAEPTHRHVPTTFASPYSSLTDTIVDCARLCKNMYLDFVKILPHLLFFMIIYLFIFCSVINTKKVESSFARLFLIYVCIYRERDSYRCDLGNIIKIIFSSLLIFLVIWYIRRKEGKLY